MLKIDMIIRLKKIPFTEGWFVIVCKVILIFEKKSTYWKEKKDKTK